MTLGATTAVGAALLALCYAAVPTRAAARGGAWTGPPSSSPRGIPSRVRIATYNIHGAKGVDGIRNLGRTAGVIEGAHIVALQEVRAGWRCDQARQLAAVAALGALFVPTLRRWFRDYRGNALLTRFPVRQWQTQPLPNVRGRRFRAYTVAELALGATPLSVLFTHLHTRDGRERQLEMVAHRFGRLPAPAVLIGDLNTRRGDAVLSGLLGPEVAVDAIASVLGDRDPQDRVDWIITRGLEITGGGMTGSGVSDHPYYWVEFEHR